MQLEDCLAATASAGARAIQLMDFDQWLLDAGVDAPRRLGHMNLRREGFADRVTAPVLLWLRPDTLRLLSREAVDLWSWRTGIFEIADGPSAETDRADTARFNELALNPDRT